VVVRIPDGFQEIQQRRKRKRKKRKNPRDETLSKGKRALEAQTERNTPASQRVIPYEVQTMPNTDQ